MPQSVRPEVPAVSLDQVVRAAFVTKVYGEGDTRVRALDGISVGFAPRRMTAVMGPSGSGKSTFLYCLAGLDIVDSGRIWIGDLELTAMDEHQRTVLRRDRLGFIFQSFNLVPSLNVRENVTLPLELAGKPVDPARLDEIITAVGLGDRLSHRPAELSGGQQQRVAAARALMGRPDVVFADEPTGNLDSRSGAELLATMRRAVDEFGQTIIMVTHDPVAASVADHIVFLADGTLAGELEGPTVDAILDRIRTLEG